MKKIVSILLSIFLFGIVGCAPENPGQKPEEKPFPNHYAEQSFDQIQAIEKNCRMDNESLADNTNRNSRANLWTYGAYFTAVAKLVKVSPRNENVKMLARNALEELEWYSCSGINAYASDNGKERPIFFDDNAWLVFGLLEMYAAFGEQDLLNKAIEIQEFIYTGWQEDLGGGLLWRQFDPKTTEDKDFVRNTCINAPSAMNAALLYKYTKNTSHLDWAKKIFAWTRSTLKNETLGTYFDCIDRAGKIQTAQFTYNSGCMLSAAALLYDITKEEDYLAEAISIAEGSRALFAHEHLSSSVEGEFYSDNAWFRVYLFQGYLDAYHYCGESFKSFMDGCLKGYDYAVTRNYYDRFGFIFDRWDGSMKPDDDPVYQTGCREACGNAQSMAVFAEYFEESSKNNQTAEEVLN